MLNIDSYKYIISLFDNIYYTQYAPHDNSD